jgi:hypothetical protein
MSWPARWWPFHRRKRQVNGEAARQARQEAAKAVGEAARRNVEIQREFNVFAAEVEAAMARRRHQ